MSLKAGSPNQTKHMNGLSALVLFIYYCFNILLLLGDYGGQGLFEFGYSMARICKGSQFEAKTGLPNQIVSLCSLVNVIKTELEVFCHLQQVKMPRYVLHGSVCLWLHLRYGDTLLASKGEHLKCILVQ